MSVKQELNAVSVLPYVQLPYNGKVRNGMKQTKEQVHAAKDRAAAKCARKAKRRSTETRL